MIDYGEIFALVASAALAAFLQIAAHPAMLAVWLVIGGAATLTAARSFVRRRRRRGAW